MTGHHAEDVLARSARGDAAAFEQIVREHQGMVFSLAYHFCGDPSAAEELAQDVFFQLYRNLRAIKSPAHLTFWLRKVTAHRSIDRARRRRHDLLLGPPLSLEDVPEPMAPMPLPEVALAGKVRRLVQALPAKRRMVVVLRYQEELELHEIAEIMEMPINTVKSSN